MRCAFFFLSFAFFAFLRRLRYLLQGGGLIVLFQPVLNFLSLLIDTSFLKRRVFWALERFLEGREERGGGKDGGWRASFFCDFFLLRFF